MTADTDNRVSKLKLARLAAGITTQQELAEALKTANGGTTPAKTTVSRIERGLTPMQDRLTTAWLDACGLSGVERLDVLVSALPGEIRAELERGIAAVRDEVAAQYANIVRYEMRVGDAVDPARDAAMKGDSDVVVD